MVDQNNQDDGFFLDDEELMADSPMGGSSGSNVRPGFKEIWQKSPALKVIFVALVGVLLVGGVVAFSFGKEDAPKEEEFSAVKAGNTSASEAPGTAELPPAYEQAVRQATEQRVQEAQATGGSALPTPIARPAERIEAPVQVEQKDPLSEWRRAAEERRTERKKKEEEAAAMAAPAPVVPTLPVVQDQQSEQQQQPALPASAEPPPAPLPTSPSPEQVQGYMQILQQQMQTVMDTQVPQETTLIRFDLGQQQTPQGDAGAQQQQQASTGGAGDGGAGGGAGVQLQPQGKPIITAGTIAYAQMLTEANSDVPGPILAEIASGPLSGGRAIGQFQKTEELLTIQFNRVVKDGVEYTVNTFAVDPATTLTALATDVNHHYFSRVIIPAAATFITGYAQAATQQDVTTTVANGTVVTQSQNQLNPKDQLLQGVNQVGQQISQVLQQDANKPITVKVAQGTRMGLLFTEAVYDPATQAQINAQQLQQQQQQGWQGYGQQIFNNTLPGQAYNAYNAYNAYANNVGWGSQQQQQQPGQYPNTPQQQGVVTQPFYGFQPTQAQPVVTNNQGPPPNQYQYPYPGTNPYTNNTIRK